MVCRKILFPELHSRVWTQLNCRLTTFSSLANLRQIAYYKKNNRSYKKRSIIVIVSRPQISSETMHMAQATKIMF
jgi:hypothetical protein